MRRKDREQSKEFAYMVLGKCEYATLSMVDLEGNPYCIPITIANDEKYIYFHSAMEGTKIDILKKNPKVCISCVGDTQVQQDKFTTLFQSAIVKGVASEILEDNEKIQALRLICQRHTPSNMNDFDNVIKRSLSRTAIYKISIEEITGKSKK
ncbi:MAG: pyridoxamine 5'-phosphate oxidase family protein [Oscillospiraceae bacterium]